MILYWGGRASANSVLFVWKGQFQMREGQGEVCACSRDGDFTL
jgi:hypothetical protein